MSLVLRGVSSLCFEVQHTPSASQCVFEWGSCARDSARGATKEHAQGRWSGGADPVAGGCQRVVFNAVVDVAAARRNDIAVAARRPS